MHKSVARRQWWFHFKKFSNYHRRTKSTVSFHAASNILLHNQWVSDASRELDDHVVGCWIWARDWFRWLVCASSLSGLSRSVVWICTMNSARVLEGRWCKVRVASKVLETEDGTTPTPQVSLRCDVMLMRFSHVITAGNETRDHG